jgi:hypothetical protein
MADITITFGQNINSSLSVGDSIYYVSLATSGGFNVSSGDIVKLGTVTSKTSTTVVVDTPDNVTVPTTSDFIFFSKDNAVNLSSLLGYYAEVKFTNNSTNAAELFSIGIDVVESSK